MDNTEFDKPDQVPLSASALLAEPSQPVLRPRDALRDNWLLLLRLCAVGFFVNCQPSEPYLTAYLQTDKGLTEEQLDNEVWPYDTYGAFLFLLPVGFAAERCGYWPVICLGLLCRQATRVILLFGEGVPLMATMQLTYAAASASNSVLWAYALAAVPTELCVAAASLPLATYHVGNVLGSLLAELLHHGFGLPLRDLFYASWVFTSLGCLASLWMPRLEAKTMPQTDPLAEASCGSSFKALVGVYGHPVAQLWSCYWLFGCGASLLVGNYFQTVLFSLDPDTNFGFAEALTEAASFAATLLPTIYPLAVLFGPRAWLLLCPLAFLAGGLVFFTPTATSVVTVYLLTAGSLGILEYLTAIGTAAIAFAMQTSNVPLRYAMVISANQFGSLALTTVLSQVLAATAATTATYYRAAAIGCVCAAAAPLFSAVGWMCRSRRAMT